jgi:Plavaka transposase
MKCWVLIAYIPCPLFITPKTKLQTAFVARLFHQCLAIILKPLKEAGENGRHLRDSHGDRRHCFLRVAAYLGDYPEQAMINVAAANNSPVTIAGHKDLGNSKPSPRRTREYILEHIARVTSMVDQSDIGAYIDQAKAFGLNAVNRPFWAELPGYEPDLVMAPDILHGLHRFWRDHPLRWVRNLMGVAQLDARLKALQPVVGYRHFSNGISHLSQWSGREDRELQRYLVAAVSGSPRLDSDSLFCLRRLHDFIYIAQYRTHSTKTLQLLDEALKDFHRFKNCFIRNGARRGSSKVVMNHFRIPKLAGLHMFSYHIPRMGSSMQFSTEIIETSHIQAAKLAFKATNRKNFVAQMCAYGDRLATLSLMEDLGAWIYEHAQARHLQHRLNRTTPPYNAFAMQALSLQQQDQPEEVHVATRALRGHIWHTVKPDIKGILVRTLTKDYALPGAFEIIAKYLESQGISSYEARNFITLDVWYRCRIQLPLAGDDASGVAESRTLQAVPPFITKTRFGLCNCGLVKLDETAGRNGIKGKSHSACYPVVF